MNDLGIALLWCTVQVTLIATVAIAIYAALKHMGPLARSTVALTGLVSIIALSAFILPAVTNCGFVGGGDASAEP